MRQPFLFTLRQLLPRAVLVAAALLIVTAPRPRALDAALSQPITATPAQRLEALIIALRYLPSDPILIRRAYDAAFAAKRLDVADAFATRLAQAGFSVSLHRLFAELRSAQGNTLAALAHHQAALDGSTQDALHLRVLAAAALFNAEWETAHEHLTRILALQPNDQEVLYRLGLLSAPESSSIAEGFFVQLPEVGNYPAIAPLRTAMAAYANARDGEYAFRIGLALLEGDEPLYAERAFRIAQSQTSALPAIEAFLAVSLARNGRDGLPTLQRAINAAPNDVLVLLAAGIYWRTIGNVELALDSLRNASAIAPNNAAIAAEIGAVYRSGGFAPQAAEWYTRAVALAPDDEGIWRAAAAFYVDENYGLGGEGLNFARTAVERFPQSAELAATYGYALLNNAQVEAARAELQRALSISPNNVRVRYYFAVLMEHQRQWESAVESYRYVVARAPRSALGERSTRALARLNQPAQ